jgi:hypothetical protein
LAELRLSARLDRRLAMRGEVTVAPGTARDEPRDYRVVWLPAVAFAGGFALATGVSLLGLVFQVLRRKA